MENRYGKLASWVYNLDKPVGRSFGDLEYYRQLLGQCDGPILEPAVGNGRVFVPLLEAGFSIEGFDASEEMLGYCRHHHSGRITAIDYGCAVSSGCAETVLSTFGPQWEADHRPRYDRWFSWPLRFYS